MQGDYNFFLVSDYVFGLRSEFFFFGKRLCMAFHLLYVHGSLTVTCPQWLNHIIMTCLDVILGKTGADMQECHGFTKHFRLQSIELRTY